MRRMQKRITVALTAAALSFGGAAVLAPQVASASALGWQQWGGFTVDVGGWPVGIPGGTLEHYLEGNRTYVRSHTASFSSWGNVCNWRVDFVYRDIRNSSNLISRGPLQSTCNNFGQRFYFSNKTVQIGTACAELFSNGVFVTRQCHSITNA